jgi:hypothetical protein
VIGRHELDAPLPHADRLDLGTHAEALEQLGVRRQQRFADMETRMTRLFEQRHVTPLARQQCGDRRAGGTAPDHQHVAGERRR